MFYFLPMRNKTKAKTAFFTPRKKYKPKEKGRITENMGGKCGKAKNKSTATRRVNMMSFISYVSLIMMMIN